MVCSQLADALASKMPGRICSNSLSHPNLEVTMIRLPRAIGNCISRSRARCFGLIELPIDRVSAPGKTALLGARITLFSGNLKDGPDMQLRRKIEPLDAIA